MVYKDTDDNVAIRPEAGRFPARFLTGGNNDLILVIGFTIITLIIISMPYFEHGIIRFVAGIAFVLFMPGYAFIAAMYPGKDDLDSLERLLLSVTFSIVLVPLLGFLFNYTTPGIRLDTMVFTTTLIIAVSLLVALVRRQMLPAGKRFSVDMARPASDALKFFFPASKSGIDRLLSIVLCGAILLTVLATAYAVTTPRPGEKYTQFYICGPGGNLSNYPTSFDLGESKPVIVGISNHEGSDKTYDLVVTMDGLGSQNRRIYSDRFVLADNQTLEKVINLTPDHAGSHMNIEFLLYEDGIIDQPYRTCNLRANVTAPAMADIGSTINLTGT